MELSESNSPRDNELWEEIEKSERYLVSCMYEEAASTSSSVLRKLWEATSIELESSRHKPTLENGFEKEDDRESGIKEEDNLEVNDMLEAAAMVFIQAYKHTNRTRDIFQDLKPLFGSVSLIPYSIILTGVCLQVHEGESLIARDTLDEFFEGWIFSQDKSCYILLEAERKKAPWGRIWTCSHLPRKKYMQIIELYTFSVLVKGLKNAQLALNWLKKADLLEEERQDMALKIRSVLSLKEANSDTSHKQEASKGKDHLLNNAETGVLHMGKASSESNNRSKNTEICGTLKQNKAVSKISRLLESLSLWFPTINLRLGNLHIAMPWSNIIFVCATMFLLVYGLKRKREFVKRNLRNRLGALRRTLIDFWQLAFNVQVNPLAAVQPLPSSTHMSR
ncbi:hypothetical protein SUGI_0126030 [Cryptomeria japonica]|uniref:protein APEM9 n=1 Tax=Cryptomeria japonica TaxID=3369 RepID=UPI002408DC0F|nr:protein APEM9 [Cryptomeria japonica]GLJ10317.1 hypothetical protein SUGI_0126030 [Cryptomeria japonica]